MPAVLGSGSAPLPSLPQPWPRAPRWTLGSAPSRFEATSQPCRLSQGCGSAPQPAYRYACGVDIVGPSNIKTLLDSIPAYWGPLRNDMLLKIGDVDNDPDFNRAISPLFHIDAIKAPLLIGQGANDPRVKQAEAYPLPLPLPLT